MRNLLNFLLKYNTIILFLFLEGIALYWLTTGNNYHNSRVVKSMQGITRGLEERVYNIRNYLNLRQINAKLAEENNSLRNRIEELSGEQNAGYVTVNDEQYGQQYQFISARIINNSVSRQKNYFSLDKGTRHGITTDMAVTDGKNAIGAVISCSENFSVAISLLNIDFKMSARIRSNGYFGSLSWDGRNNRLAVLNEIPQHITVNVGDTIETTSYSAIFPEGINIGTVSDFRKSGSDFYRIEVELFADFRKLHYVNIIGNLLRNEQIELEKQYQ